MNFSPPPSGADNRQQAKWLFWMGWPVSDIAERLGLPPATVYSWKGRDKWEEASGLERVEGIAAARLIQLITKDTKSGGDFKEIDLLGREAERFARIRRYGQPGGHEGDLNPKVGNRNAGPKKKPEKNIITEEQSAKLHAIFRESLFGYQHAWLAASNQRTRAILKSRQIGATWYFAREAFLDAIDTGRNQIFLSASKNQANLFRQYIIQFAREAEVEITGNPIVLANGAELYFLGTNARTAQGYHGNFYFDEFFWTFGFEDLNKVASAMATQKRWRKTYFSTPSSVTHQAYSFWTGEEWNRKRQKAERKEFDVSWKALQDGVLGSDRIWRQIVTIADAERLGCDLFDLDDLRDEYSPDKFANLLMCDFIDDTASVFPMSIMQACLVDSYEVWEDVDWKALALAQHGVKGFRPYGNREVWVGYDPSEGGDSAALVVAAPPEGPRGKFRLLEKKQFRGIDFAAQAAEIKAITERYRVGYIGIDATGMGVGVYQLVKQFFPQVKAIRYSPETKIELVLKASDTVRRGRLQYDSGSEWSDVTASFMAIRSAMTSSGRSATYVAGRSALTGHADLAWAAMHIMHNEPLEATSGGKRRGVVEIYE